MRRGALSFADALGFKGIWKRFSPQDVIAGLRTLSQATEEQLDGTFGGKSYRERLASDQTNGLELVRVAFLSDTIVMATAFKSYDWIKSAVQYEGAESFLPDLDRAALDMNATAIAGAMRLACSSTPALAFRGAISFGEFEMDPDGRFLVGPAVDDAAEHHERAQGAFAFLTPTALDALAAGSVTPMTYARLWGSSLVPYRVPLRDGSELETFVVNPLVGCKTGAERASFQLRILETFSSAESDVISKREHTSRFLNFCQDFKPPPPPPAMTLA